MSILADLVQQSTSTTGTGTVTLGSAVTGFRTVAASGIPDGSVVSYAILDGTNRETGTGVIGSSGTTLTRVLRASTTGSLLNLTGSATVGIAANAGDLFSGENRTLTASYPYRLNQTWNNSGVTFEGFVVNITDTASNVASTLVDFKLGSTSVLALTRGAVALRAPSGTATQLAIYSTASNAVNGTAGPNPIDVFNSSGSRVASIRADGLIASTNVGSTDDSTWAGVDGTLESGNVLRGINLGSAASVSWANSNWWQAKDIALRRDAAGTLAQRAGTTAQTWRMYETFTNASNGAWFQVQAVSSRYEIAGKANGTGNVRPILLQHGTVAIASLPTASAAGAGARMVVSDALSPTFGATVASGGSVVTPVYSDGTNWKVG